MFLMCEDRSSGSKFFQIWVNRKSKGFVLTHQGPLPSGTQAVSFADIGTSSGLTCCTCSAVAHTTVIDRDGTLDMLFVSCSSVSPATGVGSTCSINIAYNKQLPLCESSSQQSVVNGKRICRPPDDLCTPDQDFKFDLSARADNDVSISAFQASALC